MTDTQLDIIQIKQTLKDMQKNIAKIKQYLQDEYYEDKIEKLYDAAEKRNESLHMQRKQIDSNINYYISLRSESTDPSTIKYCDDKLNELLDKDIDLVLEMYEDDDDSDDEVLIAK